MNAILRRLCAPLIKFGVYPGPLKLSSACRLSVAVGVHKVLTVYIVFPSVLPTKRVFGWPVRRISLFGDERQSLRLNKMNELLYVVFLENQKYIYGKINHFKFFSNLI